MERKKGINKNCLACGVEFYVPQYRAIKAKFCSHYCQNHKQYEASRLKFTCKGCGKETEDSPSRVGKARKYCSLDCRSNTAMTTKERRQKQKALQKLKRGNNSARNLRNWVFKVKPATCQVCGYSEYKFCLDLHHIDNNPNNNTLENVAVLCCMCHRKLHKGIISMAGNI